MRNLVASLVVLVCAVGAFAQDGPEIRQGSLYAMTKTGEELEACPLKNTRVKVEITGFLARVRVTQEFENKFSEPVEAVYTFPLSQNAAVGDMTMRIGERTIRGKILRREEARIVYETAKEEGKAASLLDQERPNIFTQSVANIQTNEKVLFEITYVETMTFDDGTYEFVFAMTVPPPYIPGTVDADDAEKISPPAATRAGHDISIDVSLNAG